MNIKLPITEWFSYTPARHNCTIAMGMVGNSAPEPHLLSHRASSDDPAWANADLRTAFIAETVAGYVEAARVAFNAGTVEVARDDATLVPVSCKMYLDYAITYTLAERFKLYIVLANNISESMGHTGTKTYLASMLSEDWFDATVYLRSIRALYKTEYVVEQGAVEATTGTPVFIGRVPKARSL